jgi:hypothetical protein
MTLDLATRSPEQQAADDNRRSRRGLKGGPQITLGRPRASAPLVVGGQPRANLLPPEIILKRKQLKTRRALRFGVVLVALATAAACAGTFGIASVAQLSASSAQDRLTQLVAEQGEYKEVRDVQDTIGTITAGQLVGSSTEIDWKEYLTALQGTLPEGVVLTNVTIQSGTPMAAFAQSDGPLQGARVAALTFTATSPVLPTIPDWLRSMAKLPGFVDATPGSVQAEDGLYTADVLMHIDAEAFSMRFDPAHIAEREAEAAAAAAHANAQQKSMTPIADDPAEPATDDAVGDPGTEGEEG